LRIHQHLYFRGVTVGFTLIELIVVIVILGVLAAVALPRFTSLQGDARSAKANALGGAMRAAAGMAKATAVAKDMKCTVATGDTVAMEGANVDLVFCSPAASATGIERAANLNVDNDRISIDHTTTPGTTVVTVAGATTPATCSVTYVEPTLADARPTVTVATGGCGP